jgi:hypothetical protein
MVFKKTRHSTPSLKASRSNGNYNEKRDSFIISLISR